MTSGHEHTPHEIDPQDITRAQAMWAWFIKASCVSGAFVAVVLVVMAITLL